MFLDTMTYSMMIVAAVLSFITVLLTLFPEDSPTWQSLIKWHR